jgi:segregation and condensation protein A
VNFENEVVLEETAVPESENVADKYLARFQGEAITELPQDLYIPPDALQVFLEAFEGPLDLLLYLIRKNNLDILNIPIAEITRQYMDYVELMKDLHLELAADYLVMAAMLAEIKSRMLLPRTETPGEEEVDPRAELIRRLQEYERFKKAAEDIEFLPRLGRDIFTQNVYVPQGEHVLVKPEIGLDELLGAFLEVLKRSDLMATHKVTKEPLSVREKMSKVLDMINTKKYIVFHDCFDLTEGKMGMVVSFLAILELVRLSLIDLVQTQNYGTIHLKALSYEENEERIQSHY